MQQTANERHAQNDLRNFALAIGVAVHLDAAVRLVPERHQAAESLHEAQKAAMKLVRYLREGLPEDQATPAA